MTIDLFPLMLWAFGVVAVLTQTWIQDRREVRLAGDLKRKVADLQECVLELEADDDKARRALLNLSDFVRVAHPESWADAVKAGQFGKPDA